MSAYWINFLIFGLGFAPLIFMFITCGATVKYKIGGSLITLAFWFMTATLLFYQEEGNKERWNEGFCPCGTHWELEAVSKSKSGTETKYYSCPNCYKEIEIIR